MNSEKEVNHSEHGGHGEKEKRCCFLRSLSGWCALPTKGFAVSAVSPWFELRFLR
jgi:hypothetical protein